MKIEKNIMCVFCVSEILKHFNIHFYFFLIFIFIQFLGGRRGGVTENYELKYHGLG